MSRSAELFRAILGTLLIGAAFRAGVGVNAATQSRGNAPVVAVDVTKLGPQVGDKVPDFSLSDQHGKTRTLFSLMGSKGLVLVFNRSADW